jgi:protein TonB
MEPKKTVKADLEWRKPTFFQIGLLASLLIVFLAFEYVGAREKVDVFIGGDWVPTDEDMVENTEQPKEPPPPPQQEQQSPVIEIVRNDAVVADFSIDAETTQDEVMQEYVPVENTREEVVKEAEIFLVVEELPEFPGGEEARMKFLSDNVQYPRAAREMGLYGRVMVGFVVEPDGSISNVKILRGVASSLDDEAVRVTKLMPKWKPGKQRGRAVRAQYQMPITFVLSD